MSRLKEGPKVSESQWLLGKCVGLESHMLGKDQVERTGLCWWLGSSVGGLLVMARALHPGDMNDPEADQVIWGVVWRPTHQAGGKVQLVCLL